jgi:hypothetical protein
MPTKRTRPTIPKPRAPRTSWQQTRDDLLRRAGYTKRDVWRLVMHQGGDYTQSAVYACLDGRFRSDEIAAAFCKLTGVSRARAFPDSEPRFTSGS